MANSHDYIIENGTGLAVRTDLNNVLANIQSSNSGNSTPTTTTAGKIWADTSTAGKITLKMRDINNTSWVDLMTLNSSSVETINATTVNADNLLGQGQTWQDVKSSRVDGTIYTNTTGRPIAMFVTGNDTADLLLYVDGVVAGRSYDNIGGNMAYLFCIIPNGSTYKITSGGTDTAEWSELR